MAGTFIVIEGTDGSGKATQAALLIERLRQSGREVASVDFPRYDQPSGYFVGKYLNGGYGELKDIGPKKASLFYALDRFDASMDMRARLAAGSVVVANRYVASNMGHQGSKIADAAARKEFFGWIHELEYETLGIPKPDLNIFLHVPSDIAYDLVAKKSERAYLKGASRDLHEADIGHFRRAEATYREIVQLFPGEFREVECAPEGSLLSPEEIFERAWRIVEEII